MKINRNPSFRNSVRFLRMQHGMTQEQFALAIGIDLNRSKNPSATISGWERGDREPSMDMLCRISRRFGVTVDWLLGVNNVLYEKDNYAMFCDLNRLSKQNRRQLQKIIKVFLDEEEDKKDANEEQAAPID